MCAEKQTDEEKLLVSEGRKYFLSPSPKRIKQFLTGTDNDIFAKLYRTSLLIKGRNIVLDNDISIITSHLKKIGRPVPCAAGCSACCKQAIVASPFEAALVSAFLIEHKDIFELFCNNFAVWEDETQPYRVGYMRWAQRLYAAGIDDKTHECEDFTASCPVLANDACLIYPVRPYCCRSYIATSAQCVHPAQKGNRAGFMGMDVGSYSDFKKNNQTFTGLLWNYFGIEHKTTKLQLLPELVYVILTEEFEKCFIF